MNWRFTCLLLLAIIFITRNASAQSIPPETYYVSASKGNDANNGRLSTRPLKTLQKALDITRATITFSRNVTIQVEKGTYYPYNANNPGSNVSDSSFKMILTVNKPIRVGPVKLRIMGGYDFTTGIRDVGKNVTNLYGGSRINHVVVIGNVNPHGSDSLIIDGFNIDGGENLSESQLYNGKTGTYSYASVIPGNSFPGPLYFGSPVVVPRSGGGGIYIGRGSRVAIKNCIFKNNRSWDGAGIYCDTSNLRLENCVFENNWAVHDPTGRFATPSAGGAISFYESDAKILNCIFFGNNANKASAIYEHNSGIKTVMVDNCIFKENDGGVGYNETPDRAAIIRSAYGRLKVTNSIFHKNLGWSAYDLLLYGGKKSDLISNNLFDKPGDIATSTGPSILGAPSFVAEQNPRGPDGLWLTEDDGLQLNPCMAKNPAIDAGHNNYAEGLTTDILGKPRIRAAGIDLGPYEVTNSTLVLWIDKDGDGYGDEGTKSILAQCKLSGYALQAGDCNDNDSTIHRFAPELCDGKDNNCDGRIDDRPTTLYWPDRDGDGFGDGKAPPVVLSCPSGNYVSKAGDCNDNDKTIYPGAPEICNDGKDNNCNGKVDEGSPASYYLDADGDGYGKTKDVVTSCAPVAGRVARSGDCDDNNKTVYPGAPEICDGKDNDCNGLIDDLPNMPFYYPDIDYDGHGQKGSQGTRSCKPIAGYAPIADDCNDFDNTVYPGAPERCDGKDNNCNGQADEDFAKTKYYRDADKDGYGNTNDVIEAPDCIQVSGRVTRSGDCNDNDSTIYPGAPELCDLKDNDCNGSIDDGLIRVYYLDADGDGYGKSNDFRISCSPLSGRSLKSGDCNDADKTIYPGAPEICDGRDNDCDGLIDDGVTKLYFRDADGDGWGTMNNYVSSCRPVPGRVSVEGDCNDNDPAIHPDAPEIPGNGKDDNCNGQIDEEVCTTPTLLTATNITGTSALLKWASITDSAQWQVRYRQTGGPWIIVIPIPGTTHSLEIRNLNCGKAYEWQIRSICGSTVNAYDRTASFNTIPCASGNRSATVNESDNETANPQLETKVWPNPTNGSFTLSVKTKKSETQIALIKVVNLNGKIVHQENATISNGVLLKKVNMPRRLASGIYIVYLVTKNMSEHFEIEYLK